MARKPEIAPEDPTPPLVLHVRKIADGRRVPAELLWGALEEALRAAYRAETGSEQCAVQIDPETGAIALYARRRVVDAVADPAAEIAIHDARGYEVGDFVDRLIDHTAFRRVAALASLDIIERRALEFERERAFQEWSAREGQLVSGLVQREEHGTLVALLDRHTEGYMPRWERSPRERHQINQRVVFEIAAVRKARKGYAVILSRGSERFVRLLLDDPHIVAAARDPGKLTLLLVTRPLAASAIEHVSRQIRDERIEQIRFTGDDPLAVVRTALAPAEEHVDYQVLKRADLGVTICVTDDRRTFERAPLAGRLVGRKIVSVMPTELDELVADLESRMPTPEAEQVAAVGVDVDDLRARIEAFARERALAEPIEDEVE